MKHRLLFFVFLSVCLPTQAQPQKAGKTGCEIDVPADWKVQQIGDFMSAKSGKADAEFAVTKGYGGLQSAKASWKSLLKVKQTLEDSQDRWWVEVEPDKAHAGMQSFAVFAGDATRSCMVNLHARPSGVDAVKAIAKTVKMAP